jgi:hypothetical protein
MVSTCQPGTVSAFPPYPEPYDQISLVSGKCEMHLSGLHDHGTSSCPGSRGAPTACTALTNRPPSSIGRSAGVPIRVMIRIDVTTYGESVISTPSWDALLPSGPMQNGITGAIGPATRCPSALAASPRRTNAEVGRPP